MALDFSSLEVLTAAVQFAPVALIIVDKDTRLRRANKMAEAILGLDPTQCQGQPFSRWVVQDNWHVVVSALDRARDAKLPGSGAFSIPAPSAVNLQTRATGTDPPGKPFLASLSCSSCSTNRDISPMAEEGSAGSEAWSIISLTADWGGMGMASTSEVSGAETTTGKADATSSSRGRVLPIAGLLRDRMMDNIGYAIIAVSADGRTSISNRACDILLRSINDLETAPHRGGVTRVSGTMDSSNYGEGQVDLDWLLCHFTLCDPETWKERPPNDFPMYKAGILGQSFRGDVVGALTDKGQKRKLISCDGFPLYDDDGRFIGGMITMTELSTSSEVVRPPQKVSTQSEPEASGSVDFAAMIEGTLQHLGVSAYSANSSGELKWFNDSWYEYSGCSRKDKLESNWNTIHPEDTQRCRDKYVEGLSSGTHFEIQNRVRRKDGVYRWVTNRIHPVKTKEGTVVMWIGMITDIDDLATVSSAHREARENLSDAVKVADITLWSVDLQGVITLAEGSLAQSLPPARHAWSGETTAEGHSNIGHSIFEEWGEDQREPIQQALTGSVVSAETTVRGRTYRTQYRPKRAKVNSSVSFAATATQMQGPIVGVTGLSIDITERLEMEKKFEQSAREVAKAESASHAAEEASRMKSQFLAVISHEIRTPMNGVVGLCELLLDIDGLPEEARTLVHSILRSSGALLTVINDVLDFSKVEAGKLDLTPSGMSLRTVCQDVMFLYQRLWASKGLTFNADITQLPDEMVMGDAGRVAQVLNNLFGNAGKFTSEGSINFVAKKELRPPGFGAAPHYAFTISDTGCGIPRDQQDALFQPFRQADPSTSRRYGGSGLGLAICKALVELMGGQISLESEEGVGTSIHFSIPFSSYAPGTVDAVDALPEFTSELRATPDIHSAKAWPKESQLAIPESPSQLPHPLPALFGSKGLLLLAEDNLLNARIAVKTLSKLQYNVDHAENGLEVLELLSKEKDDRRYSLILMDAMMPLCDGFECTRLIRTNGKDHHRRLPIIACTAAVVNGRTASEAAGMTDFLPKPTRRGELAVMLEKWVGKNHDGSVRTDEA